MEFRYYPDTDTAYIYLLEPGAEAKVDESEEVAPGVVVDFDSDERPVGIEIYDEARAKLQSNGVVVLCSSEDERALEIGRSWLAGYRAGQDDWEPGERSSQRAVDQAAVETAVDLAVEIDTAHENRSEETATVRDGRSGQATERGSTEETTGRAE